MGREALDGWDRPSKRAMLFGVTRRPAFLLSTMLCVFMVGGCSLDLAEPLVCNEGERQFEQNGHCYWFVTTVDSWVIQQARCNEAGGALASVVSPQEFEFVRSVASSSEGFSIWIGGTDAAQPQTFAWSDGEPWDYAPWRDGHPNVDGGCVGLHFADQLFFTDLCGRKFQAVCER